MIQKEACVDIWSMSKQGYSQRQIARKLGIHRMTVKKYLEKGEFPVYAGIERKSQLEPYHQMIKDWLRQEDYRGTRIYELLKPQGYAGSYQTVKRYVRKVKEERDRIAYVRFETIPGQQGQVDFGEMRVIMSDGREQKLYIFVMVLGFSRHMYVEFVDRCTMPVFLDCHIRAFEYFGGVPGELLYDNMKNVVVKHLVGKVKFNDTMLDFGKHYRYKPVACPAYSPWYKGKVERPIDYIRESFWRGYVYTSLEKTNEDVFGWLNTTAYQRVHGTTHQRVCDRFAAEKPNLGDIPRRPYDTAEKYIRKVHKDCQFSFGGNRYIVSHKLVGRKVLVKVKDGIMRIYLDDRLQQTYKLAEGKGRVVGDPKYYEELRRDREQLRKKYRKPYGKGKATIGLRKHDNYTVNVQIRDMAEYERFSGGASCPN